VTAQPVLHYDPASTRQMIRNEEELVKTVFVLAALLALAAGMPEARAQEQQSFKTVIGKGYDIKSVIFAKGEATDNREAFVVTLQKEKSVAVCFFAAPTWISMTPQALDDGKRCDVR
jgi:hypothetical protein